MRFGRPSQGYGYVIDTVLNNMHVSGSVPPLRKVVRSEFFATHHNRSGEGSVEHFLECGHSVFAKQSAGYPLKKRCRECARPENRQKVQMHHSDERTHDEVPWGEL